MDVLLARAPATDDAGNLVGLPAITHDITAARVGRRDLEASERGLVEAQRIAGLGSFEVDVLTGQMTWSAQLYRILGVDPGTAPSVALYMSVVHPEDRVRVSQAAIEASDLGASTDLDYRILRPDGQLRSLRTRGVPERDEHGTVVRRRGTVLDDTERAAAERARAVAESRFEVGFDQAGIGAAIVGLDGIPRRVNPAACALLGRPADLLVNRRWSEYTHPDDVPLWQALQAPVAAGADGYADERRYLRPDGAVVWAAVHVSIVKNASGEPQYFLTQLQDVTGRKQMEQELAHLALHDSLTGLANRALLIERLVEGLARVRRQGHRLAVMFLDVDHFKNINDSLGHTRGDDLLRQVADRLMATIRRSDTVARFGGDEFVIACDDLTDPETVQLSARILEILGQPFLIEDEEITITASLGIAIADEEATPESLLRDADIAMYQAKKRGRDRVELFDETLRAQAGHRLDTAAALRHALERGELSVHYQPVVDLVTGAMVSAEALVRWQRPGHGMVSPAEFIPLAEETGLIVPIGAWVLERACRELAHWQRTNPAMWVAVNLSVRQVLSADIVELVKDVVTRTGIPPQSLCLELTETVFMEDVKYFANTLAALKSVGVRLSIDDFGTGYSSLNYLKRFPFDNVKVDRAFVNGLGTDPNDTALVGAIIAMADALGLDVTAEGIETRQQLATLQGLGCPRAQGFYFSRPVPPAELGQLVTNSQHWNVD